MTPAPAPRDEIRFSLPLAYRVDLPVLGINTRFATNSSEVADSCLDAFGGWRCVQAAAADASPFVNVNIVVRDNCDDTNAAAVHDAVSVRHFSPDADRIVAYSPGNIGLSDPATGDATAVVTSTLVADRARFRESMLEALTFALLSSRDRHPLHAAAIARNDHAILLAGASGSGKSTLAHLAHSAGITVMSEDHVWIQQVPDVRVWGTPGYTRLLPQGGTAKTDKVTVSFDRTTTSAANYTARDATVCLLERGQRRAALVRVSSEMIARVLTGRVDAGFDRFPDRHPRVVAALAARGGWRLTLSSDPRDALPFLETMLDQH